MGGACASYTTALAQVEESAVSLWNWTVTKHTGAVIDDEQRAKLRFVACRLICLCEGSDPPEGTIRRQILMSMKTGKGWIDIGKAGLADGFLENAMSSVEKLYAKLRKGSEGEADIQVHRADVEKSLFKVLSYQAESAVAQGDFQKAVMCVQRCKDMLMNLPKETCYLSILCYNFGVETYEWKRYEQSSFWLSQSYDIGKMDMKYSVGKEMQAKVLRLLATTYFEWDCSLYLDKALKAISLANQENLHPAGFFLKVKILLKSGASDEDINSALAEFMHLEMSLDFCLNTAKLLLEHGRESVGFDFLKSVPERFESSPDLGKITLLHIEFLLKNKRELLAKQKIEEVIIGHYTGKQLLPEALNQLHIILWDRAAKRYEEKSYSEALHWYNYSVSFYTPGQIDQNLAKLQRNMASCYLHLKQLDKAKEAVKQAERCDPNSIFTKFSVYKIAVMENDTDKAVEAVIEMGKLAEKTSEHEGKLRVDKNTGSNLLSLAAQIALENDQQIVAIKALEYLSEHLQDCRQLFAALKCLVRLMLSKVMAENAEKRDEDINSIVTYLNLAHKKLAEFFTEEEFTGDMRILEAHWFRKVAWNLAVQFKDSPEKMRDFFVLSFKLSQFCPSDKAVLIAQKTCLLMAAAVDLEMGRQQVTPSEQTELFSQALQHLQTCKEIWKVLKLTALAMESPARYPVLCKKALKSALNLHRKQAVIDAVKFSKCLHSLINISLPTGLTDLDTCVLQEVWDYFEDALSVVSSTDAYPEMEILWLMTRAWNTGIFQYTVGKYKEAEQWCGLGMRFLNHLGSLKKSYEGHMVGLYSEVLDKLDRAKGFIPNEE
ncbi:PREDICTED: testis-expressed sequence 11 protein isoform X2 [Corvus brachyrhynchos]|uniref:testis-expressed sequence 11 protein isoform X2 n=2 Tax=Corvus TaxID=30420 RepID=UPI0008165202|nr:PREDICTED: testis-expressed sequence 11 protein isoform X2 [Corvus brachyrhynchos]